MQFSQIAAVIIISAVAVFVSYTVLKKDAKDIVIHDVTPTPSTGNPNDVYL